MFKRIDHVEIIPANFERTIAFYTEIFGFRLRKRYRIDKPPIEEVAYLELGDTVIEVISVTNPPPRLQEPWQVGYRGIALEVKDMEKAVDYLKTKGIALTLGPVNLGTSMRAELKDPDGLTLELRQWFK